MGAPVPRWLPNAISVVRVLLVPAWVWFAECAQRNGDRTDELRLTAAGVLLAIGLSDLLDGWLARRYSLQSQLGATIDAVADKLAQVVLTTWLAVRHGPAFTPIPLWFLAMLIVRDGLLLVGYIVIRRRCGRVETEHEWHGKAASLVLFGLLVALSFGARGTAVTALLVASSALVVFSTGIYVRRGLSQLRRE